MIKRRMAAAMAVLVLTGGLAACGDDDDSVGGAVDTVTSAVGEGARAATDAAGEGAEAVTESAGELTGEDTQTTVEIPAATQGLAFARVDATAPAGTVTLRMPNPSDIPHNIALEDPAEEGEIVGTGGVSEVTADLDAGTYTYYCSVPGHRDGGMEGTLTVR